LPSGSERPRGAFDLPAKEARVAELNALIGVPGFWDDQRKAQRILREADGLQGELALWRDLESRATGLEELADLAAAATDLEMLAEIEREADALGASFERERTALLFSGEYDQRGALVTISAGAGGTEATDWAEMLLRMFLRWAERHRFSTEVLDQTEGEQTGLKSVTFDVDGRRAYGWLRAERGVHRLVRISPYDSQKRRQTTFALIEVMPEVEDVAEVELDWDEIRVEMYRSSGAGGQHVQKTNSAVRLTHLPTGIVVTCQNERSATQNRETAAKVLAARLLERRLEENEIELRRLKGEHVEAGWGNQIRSYVLHPYQMVKDHRTGLETSNTASVLDGDLDAFMAAELEREATDAPVAGGSEAAPA
jgi:peptide chain release factor 2